MREESNPLPLWRGHRVFGVDGSKVNVPYELLSEGFKAPNKHQYYPQGLMSTLYHLGSGLIYDGILSAEKGERLCLLAHMLLIKLARIFEAEADKQFPPPSSDLANENKVNDHKNSYWSDFCGEIKKFKVNFKNCLLVVGRSLEKLLFPGTNKDFSFLGKILNGISAIFFTGILPFL